MSDEVRSLPPANVRTAFLDSGEEVAVYAGSDFGVQPDWDKRAMLGWGLIIRGLSEETYHEEGSSLKPARSIYYNVIDGWIGEDKFRDDPDTDPWGMLFTDATENPQDWGTNREARDTSPVLKNVRKEFRRNGGRPFLASLEWVETVPAKGNAAPQGYYKLAAYTRNATTIHPKA